MPQGDASHWLHVVAGTPLLCAGGAVPTGLPSGMPSSPIAAERARIDPGFRLDRAFAATYRVQRQADLLGADPQRDVTFFGLGSGDGTALAPGQVDVRA
jgi:hypothetical protein